MDSNGAHCPLRKIKLFSTEIQMVKDELLYRIVNVNIKQYSAQGI